MTMGILEGPWAGQLTLVVSEASSLLGLWLPHPSQLPYNSVLSWMLLLM